jgi:hypothetical protein
MWRFLPHLVDDVSVNELKFLVTEKPRTQHRLHFISRKPLARHWWGNNRALNNRDGHTSVIAQRNRD